jgi:hypothetical protein
LQLASIQKFTTNSAVVTTTVARSGETSPNVLDCVENDGFGAKLP